MEILIYIFVFIAGLFVAYFVSQRNFKLWSQRLNSKVQTILSNKVNANDASNDVASFPLELQQTIHEIEAAIKQKKDSVISSAVVSFPSEELNQKQKIVDNLYIVNDLGQRLTSSLNLTQTFHHLHTTINSMMDAAVVELSVNDIINNSEKYFSNLKFSNDDIHYVNHMAEWSLKNNREVFLEDGEHDYGRFVFQPLAIPEHGIAQSIMIFPINNNADVSGTLSVISFQKRMFDSFHQEVIRLLLGYISVAIRNAITHDELNRTKIRAEQNEKFKEQFLANMSHEIRTPINAVTGMTRLLLEKSPREDQYRYLESIRNASDSLLVIINDILDLSKIEAGKIELEEISFSLGEVLKNVIEIMQFKAEEKGLLLSLQGGELLEMVLIGDPTRLSQILINLIGNSIKFTDKGSITIRLAMSQVNDDSSSEKRDITFAVHDTGIGMTNEQQEKLFTNYAQASSDTTRKYGGTGLGLSISRQLVLLQKGKISVSSKVGEGSVFSFTIPYLLSDMKPATAQQQAIASDVLIKLKGIRVLLADDNEYNRIVAKETLQLNLREVTVDEALDGVEAVELLKKNNYDVILMDLVMPKMDGLEATTLIRTSMSEPKRSVPIIALTASVIKSEIERSKEIGMDGFIPKPFKPNEMFSAIYNVLYNDNLLIAEIPVKPIKKSLKSDTVVDINCMQEFADGDVVRLQRFIDLFLTKTPERITSLNEALKKEDYEEIRIISHSIKPQLRFTGVIEGLELAEIIEQYCADGNNKEEVSKLIEKLSDVCKKAITELQSIDITQLK